MGYSDIYIYIISEAVSCHTPSPLKIVFREQMFYRRISVTYTTRR